MGFFTIKIIIINEMTKIICYSLFRRTSFLCADVKKRSKRNHLPALYFSTKSLVVIEFYEVQSGFSDFALQLFLRRIGGAFLSISLSNLHSRAKNGSNQPNGNSNPGFLPQLSFKNCLPFMMVQNSLSTFLKQLIGHASKPYACKLLFES